MKVKELIKILQSCHPDIEVVIEDTKTKEVFKTSYCEVDYYKPKKSGEQKKVFIGVPFK